MMEETANLILVVDDIPTNLEVLWETLSLAGFEVAVATSGERAIQQIQYAMPSLILLDVMMPGLSGFETCKQIKSNPATCHIPIIFMTALSDSIDKVMGLELGAADYITKPFNQDEVLARIRTQLKVFHLSQALEMQNQQLQTLNAELESRVVARTAELSRSLERLQQTQLQLVQSEKMSALGNLVAGFAHEVGNPINFIAGNLQPAQVYIQDLLELLDLYQQHCPTPSTEIQAKMDDIDLEYVRLDLPRLLSSMQVGVERIRDISQSLRIFSRADRDRPSPYNLHEGLDSTLLILQHRLKESERRPAIQVTRDYGELPLVDCFSGPLNQVFMNLLANAIDALEERNPTRSYEEIAAEPNQIAVTTRLSGDRQTVTIAIRDNGVGMTPAVQERMFDHLFTTKEAGRGTGLGLAIAWSIVVDQHGGSIAVDSTPGAGTEFVVTLPVQHG